jgi:hypothetical protein
MEKVAFVAGGIYGYILTELRQFLNFDWLNQG